MYYTYVLKSDKDNNFYVGFTKDLKQRFDQHNKGNVESTRHRRPLNLVYYEACIDKADANTTQLYLSDLNRNIEISLEKKPIIEEGIIVKRLIIKTVNKMIPFSFLSSVSK